MKSGTTEDASPELIYTPVRVDSIDKKMAEFINNYPERSKLKIMFVRVSKGIYKFGS